MTSHTVRLFGKRGNAHRLVDAAPDGSVCKIEPPRRTLSQNDKFHAMLTDISLSKPGGHSFTPDEWKARIMHACGWECQFLPGLLDGRPFPIGFRSSKLTKAQMSALIDWMQAWGDENGVRWSE